MILLGLALVVFSPVILTLILIATLLSRQIFANVVYFVVLSCIAYGEFENGACSTCQQKAVFIWGVHAIMTFLRIALLCVYRRTQTFHRLALQTMVSCIQLSVLQIGQSQIANDEDQLHRIRTLCTWNYCIIGILFVSEFWIRTSANKLIEVENELLNIAVRENQHPSQIIDKFSEIDRTLKIERDYKADISFLHCYTKSSKQNLVILHGYVVGKMVFSLAIRSLARYFHVYIIDAPGNGLSRPVWLPWVYPPYFYSGSGAIDKFDKWTAEKLEKFRRSVFGENGKIYLMGHSTGSYQVSCYALFYPQKLDYLILCSPVCLLAEEQYLHTSGLLKIDMVAYGIGASILSQYTWGIWAWPDLVRGLGILGPYIFIKLLRHTNKHHAHYGDLEPRLSERMSNAWFSYTYHLHAQPKSYEDLLFAYMLPWCWPRNPLLTRLPEKLQKNLLLLYSEREQSFCGKYGGKLLIEKLKAKKKEWPYEASMENAKLWSSAFPQ